MFSSLNSDTRKPVKAHNPSEDKDKNWRHTVNYGPAGAECASIICFHLACAIVCIKKMLNLLTFTGEEFFKGLFPPKTFLQGWSINRQSIIRFILDSKTLKQAHRDSVWNINQYHQHFIYLLILPNFAASQIPVWFLQNASKPCF